jgi:hypothetical protein
VRRDQREDERDLRSFPKGAVKRKPAAERLDSIRVPDEPSPDDGFGAPDTIVGESRMELIAPRSVEIVTKIDSAFEYLAALVRASEAM